MLRNRLTAQADAANAKAPSKREPNAVSAAPRRNRSTLKRRVTSLPPAMRPIVSPVVLILSASGLAARNC